VYENVRDTALYYPLRERMGITHEGKFPALRSLARDVLGVEMQEGEHCPVSFQEKKKQADVRSRTRARP